jgi:hypothetical protein
MEEPTSNTAQGSTDELVVDYANNTQFEPTVWDLKLIFGEFSARTNTVDWHTSVTVPWAQAKLMLYYLAINVAAHELQAGGPIQIPPSMLPPEAVAPSGSDDTPINRTFFDIVRDHRERFLETLKKR